MRLCFQKPVGEIGPQVSCHLLALFSQVGSSPTEMHCLRLVWEIRPWKAYCLQTVLLSWQQYYGPKLPEAHAGNQVPKLPLLAGSVLQAGQKSHRTALSEAHVGNQALVCPLPAGSVLLSWQQLPWLPEAYTPTQVDPRALLPGGHQTIQAPWPCCPIGALNLLNSARNLPPHTQVNPRLQSC
jgi:hypothetical protein